MPTKFNVDHFTTDIPLTLFLCNVGVDMDHIGRSTARRVVFTPQNSHHGRQRVPWDEPPQSPPRWARQNNLRNGQPHRSLTVFRVIHGCVLRWKYGGRMETSGGCMVGWKTFETHTCSSGRCNSQRLDSFILVCLWGLWVYQIRHV